MQPPLVCGSHIAFNETYYQLEIRGVDGLTRGGDTEEGKGGEAGRKGKR